METTVRELRQNHKEIALETIEVQRLEEVELLHVVLPEVLLLDLTTVRLENVLAYSIAVVIQAAAVLERHLVYNNEAVQELLLEAAALVEAALHLLVVQADLLLAVADEVVQAEEVINL